MHIDPKAFTFDALERDVLEQALRQFIATKRSTRARLFGRDDKSRLAIERNEAATARAEDLLTRIA